LSRRLDFIRKKDKTETLLRKRRNGLEYSSKVATIYKILKDLVIKQRIQDVYKGDAEARIAREYAKQGDTENERKTSFLLDKTGLIRFKKVVYLPKRIRKEFVKEIYKEPLVRHLGIDKTREAVTACYYFPSISRVVEKVVKECDTCNKLRTATYKPYRLLMSLLTLKEL
jgi:Integrase zinc binding domain